MTRASALAPLLLCAIGCGGGDEDRLAARRELCATLAPGMTLREADQRLAAEDPFLPVRLDCAPNFRALGEGETCPYAGEELCNVGWQWVARDQDLCSPGGCAYRCEARVVGSALSGDTPICGRAFLSGQVLVGGAPIVGR